MDRSDFDDIRWRIEEADYRSLEQFCKATQSDLKPHEIRGHVEAYLLERFDNVACVFLDRVTDLNDIDQYGETLKSWCDEILPGLGRDFGPELDEAALRRIKEVLGSIDGRIIGSVDRGKLAQRVAHWKAEAISRARRLTEARAADGEVSAQTAPNQAGDHSSQGIADGAMADEITSPSDKPQKALPKPDLGEKRMELPSWLVTQHDSTPSHRRGRGGKKGSMDRPSQADPIWIVRATQKDPIPVTRLSGEVEWINPSAPRDADDAAVTPENELRITEVTLGGRFELRSELEAAFGGPVWPEAGAIVEPFRRYAIKVFDVNATAYRKSASTQGSGSDEVLHAMASNLLVEVFGREWESSPGENVIRTDWQQGTKGWKGREFVVVAGDDPDPTCLYHELISDAVKYRYRFHDPLPAPIPGEPPGINLSNLDWWRYIGLSERHNLAMAIKPYLDDRVEYWQQQLIHKPSTSAESEGAGGPAKRNASRQSAQPESATINSHKAPCDSIAMESPTRIRFEAGLALAEVTLAQDLKDSGPSLEIARKYVVNATLALARCILTPSCLEPYPAIQRAYDFAEYFAADAMKTAWVWLCVWSEMNTSGKLLKYNHGGKPEDGGPKGMSESEIREWHSCLHSVAHEALDEFVPEFWKERLKYLSTVAESSKEASPATSGEAAAITTTGPSAGEGPRPAAENTIAQGAQPGAAKHEDTKPRPGKERKGDASLLAGKRAVNFRTAEQYLGLTERQRQNLVKDQVLVVEGKGQNKKITSDSLRAYLPPENPN